MTLLRRDPVFVVGDRVVVPGGRVGEVRANDQVTADGTRRYLVSRIGGRRMLWSAWFDEDELVGAEA